MTTMGRTVRNHLLQSMTIILLLMRGVFTDTQPGEKVAQETKEIFKNELAYPQPNVLPLIPILKPKNQKHYGHLATLTVHALADISGLSKDYIKRETPSENSYTKNTRPFQQLGLYSKSLTRQMQQQRERKARKPTPLVSSQVPHLYNNLRLAPLTSMAQSATNAHADDSKRTVFLSSGWAPSGLGETRSEIKSENEEGAEKKMTTSSYAFTSNHWGPMGKRQNDIRIKSLNYTKRLMDLGEAYRKHESKNELNNPNFVEITYDRPELSDNAVQSKSYDVLQPLFKVSPEIGNMYAGIPLYEFLKPFIVNMEEFKRKGKFKKTTSHSTQQPVRFLQSSRNLHKDHRRLYNGIKYTIEGLYLSPSYSQ